MSAYVVVGCQWGDEGKGKLVDWLAGQVDAVVRYQGGSNAGHTVVSEGRTLVLHLVPSGILRGALAVLGNGVVVDPKALLEEIDLLERMGVPAKQRLRVDRAAHLVMPYHKSLDQLREQLRGPKHIGTTGRGIGPAYEDKAARCGLRIGDFAPAQRGDVLVRLQRILREKRLLFQASGEDGAAAFDRRFSADALYENCLRFYESLEPQLCDASLLVHELLEQGQGVLFEGAQGTGLDVDHGTYPYVTSSNTLAGGVCAGVGIGPTRIRGVIGVTKAYTTRVGEGPLPTELREDPAGKHLQERGQEFGATTGRVRRCGWFDAVVVRRAARLNGIGAQAVMKLDVLDGLERLRIAVAYRNAAGHRCEMGSGMFQGEEGWMPEYEELPGWNTPIRGIHRLEELPKETRHYLDRIAELTGIPVGIVSTGPEREATIPMAELPGPLADFRLPL